MSPVPRLGAREVGRLIRLSAVRVVLGCLAFSGALVLAIWVLPAALNPQSIAGVSPADRLVAVTATRSTMVTLLAATGALITVIYTVRTYTLSRIGQVTDRYSRAVGQLGADQPAVRIGGIYALESIARDSASDQRSVVEVLVAFIRTAAASDNLPVSDEVQAALTVLGRRRPDSAPLDLRDVDLRGADLSRAYLAHAHLDRARLDGAVLIDVDLREAVLADAVLAGAKLIGARLHGADLTGADLLHADLYRAQVQRDQLAAARTCKRDPARRSDSAGRRLLGSLRVLGVVGREQAR